MTTIDCRDRTTRQINTRIRELCGEGETEITLVHPNARHNLAVALLSEVRVTLAGSAGYYCGAMMDGASVHIEGSAGWGTGEGMLTGRIVVERNAGNGAAASIRGGTVVVKGSAGARAGIAMKGGLLVVGGNAGYMTGFLMQKGVIIICGDAGEATADSMYEGTVYVAGRTDNLGNDTQVGEPSGEEAAFLAETLATHGLPAAGPFKKIVSARKLWSFDKKELDLWRAAL